MPLSQIITSEADMASRPEVQANKATNDTVKLLITIVQHFSHTHLFRNLQALRKAHTSSLGANTNIRTLNKIVLLNKA